MAKLIALQAGHENAKNNCDPALRGGTGAPGEVEFTIRIRNKLKDILLSKAGTDGKPAFQIQLVDATFNCNPERTKDFSLFLAIHYDADIYGSGGGFIDYPEPNTDGATVESQRIKREIESEYFKHSGIENKPERSNKKTRYYYMWRALSAKTPCVIIECGVGQNAHDKVILADENIVANALARGICKAFGVAYDQGTIPTPTPPAVDWEAKYKALEISKKKTVDDLTWAMGKIAELKSNMKKVSDQLLSFIS